MSDNQKKIDDIVSEAARARKSLAKQAAWKFSSANTRKMELQTGTDPILGEFAVLCTVGPYGSQQYTLSHPIGMTDLDGTDWVLTPTGEIPATIARRFDPKQAEINMARAASRLESLKKNGLVVVNEQEGSFLTFYPSDKGTPRNAFLNEAKAHKKAAVSKLKLELSKLGKAEGFRKQELNSKIQQVGDLLQFLPEKIQSEEIQIRKHLNAPGFEEGIANKHPYLHRTLVGPFGDQPQRAIIGAKGFPIADVLGAMHKKFYALDLSKELGGVTSRSSNPRGTKSRNRRGRGGQTGKKA